VFSFEAAYFVANDQDFANNVGWKPLTSVTWNGLSWSFGTSGFTPNPGPRVSAWGDVRHEVAVPDDGEIWLATQVTDNGDGTWHYEYALYNARSHRGIRAFEVPTGSATITNVGFHAPNLDAIVPQVENPAERFIGRAWAATTEGGVTRWATGEFSTRPNAPALHFQTMYNFRFDADAAPEDGFATGRIFRPGTGTSVTMNTRVPSSGDVPPRAAPEPRADFVLAPSDPNPFSDRTKVSFSLARETDVTLSVVDVSGRLVRVLHRGVATLGETNLEWDGRDSSGGRVASGVYFFRLESRDQSVTTKATLLR